MNGVKNEKKGFNFDIEQRLTAFGKAVLQDRYLLAGEDYKDMFVRVAKTYANDDAHAERLYEYMAKMWFMPSTPILSNGGANRGLPISCFLNESSDSLTGIAELWNENVWLASKGGGIGSYWGNVRSIGESIGKNGKTSGIMPFIKVMDSLTLAISQGSLRRGSAAVYLPVDHPEIEEFIDIRRQTGDHNRRSLNLHHGICIPDAFMEAVAKDDKWSLKSPATGEVMSQIGARDLWIRILNARMEMGEPYILFTDTVNAAIPEHHKKLGLKVKTSNLCSEITLPTGIDHLGNERTAVCCLSSLNIEYFDEWKEDGQFIKDVMYMLDNVLTDFINRAPADMKNAVYSATRERSIGLGTMGLHSFFHKNMVAFESAPAKSMNKKIFAHIKEHADIASKEIAVERGPCLDAAELGIMERFSNKTAIAPTASISIITGGTSAGIEPSNGNYYTHKTLTGAFPVKNKYLEELLEKMGQNTDEIWSSIASNDGSVSHLEFLSDYEKAVFKTAHEINQVWLVDLMADRAPFIDQAASNNLFVRSDISKLELHKIHFDAWQKGVKSLYYLRSMALSRAEKVSVLVEKRQKNESQEESLSGNLYEECLVCQ
ncbi:ribonucleoside-diphosphate reductase subunit alpha [Candidatus Deianiraea vastatrix]|uniref:Ribonucleoside-diphosphate reductase n=1 Tax=Candidatus Deianiraea vastatrix TaxID=2163644 RepID=A0A5B8XG52_9RICK|nr:ribonucleoside-diphosphate reductase subunit alpha [Candidatus Deianiraea vastatrix]QED23845.1 Ribonucleoside-diphosphate reductase large subunit [Candidatus Deianiraea vastatrix]